MTTFPVLNVEDTKNLHFYSIPKKCFAEELRGGFIFIITLKQKMFPFLFERSEYGS